MKQVKIFVNELKKVKNLMLVLAIAAAPLLTSCEKKEPIDPNIAKIDQLKKEIVVAGNEVRAAVEPAKTNPNNISNAFDTRFGLVARDDIRITPTNIVDSAKVFVITADKMMTQFGDVANPVNMTTLKNKSNALLAKDKQLHDLLQNAK